jgi:putative ABC transport system permease protein
VAAIAGIGSFSGSLVGGLAREGRVILGGDLAFSLVQREASAAERAFLATRGRLSVAATLRAMARTADGRNALVEVKAVDRAYPLYGELRSEPAGSLESLTALRDGAHGALADAALLARLDLKPGERIRVGDALLDIRAVLTAEPDKVAAGIAFGPRLMIGEAALRASGLLQPGSLVRWHYRLRLADFAGEAAVAETIAAAKALHPDAGWSIRTRANASPEVERNIERFTQYLTLVGLTALLIGGVGVANAVKSYLDRKRNVIATLKAMGATGGRIFAIYLTEVMLLAAFGTAVGLVAGAALPFVVAGLAGASIPLPLEPALYPGQLVLAAAYGLLTAFAFSLWPLGRAHDVPVSALFRDDVAPQRRFPRRRYIVATTLAVLVLAALALALAYDRRVAAIFVAAAAATFLALRLMAALLMALARRAPRPRSALVRLALANIHRPGTLTPTIVLSLGLGLALLVTLTLIDGNLRRQFTASLPERAPSFFFVDIQTAQKARFEAFVGKHAGDARLELAPMLRGRIVSVNGTPAEALRPPPYAAWVLQNDRGITYTDTIPPGSRVVDGAWWRADDDRPLVSLENRIAEGLGVGVGDSITVNVLGRNVTARVANLRAVDWQTLGINFVLVFSPAAFAGAPHAHIATLTYPGPVAMQDELALFKAVAEAFPEITTVRIKEVLESVAKVVADLAIAIRGASAVTLLAAVLVLAGGLAAGHRHRVYDAVILKTLGATRGRLLAAYALEYLAIGLATAVFGVAAGSVAAWLIMTEIMNLAFQWLPGPAMLAALGALALTVAFGLIGTFSALGQKPAPVLRNL